MSRAFEFFDHTADVGVRVRADTLAGLLCAGGEALYAVIGRLETAGDVHERPFQFSGDDLAVLLRDYLAELLVLFERQRRIASDVTDAVFDGHALRVTTRLAAVDRRRSTYQREVKAVTYHELELHRTADGYEASFIVDI
jgi:SHS2 domain-containing protein